MINGIQTFQTANDMYLYCTRDSLVNGMTISRKGRLYKSIKPYALAVENTEYPYIMMPGSCYHDTPAWMLWELLDFILGEEILGGYSVAWDKHRRTVYPKGNGDSDWAYKKALGRMNENQVEWAQRSLRLDSASRNCVIVPWHPDRDLKQYVANKERDLQRGDTYQRLPCITTIQFSQRERTKMLDSFQYQRSLDFTGAIHTDLWRFSEIADYLARTSYPGGQGGSTTIFVGTLAIESYGAAAFVKFNKALEWWCNEPGIRNLQYNWPSNKDGLWYYDEDELSSFIDPNKPRQKQYDYFLDQFENLATVARHFYYCRFEEGLAAMSLVTYQYYRDWAFSLMAFAAQRLLERREQLESSLYDSKKIKASLEWIDTKLHDNPNYFVQNVTNYYQYHVLVETVRNLMATGKSHLVGYVEPTCEDNEWVMIGVMIDAMLYTSARQRSDLVKADPQYKDIVEFYNSIFG
jgi:thymidylate synthase